ncbi:MAG: hypothetical protein SGARI_004534, partial [Bacillariaceae sp.]
MSDTEDHPDALQAVHGEESEEDEQADVICDPRMLDYAVTAVPEAPTETQAEEETTEAAKKAAKEAAKEARKKEMKRYTDALSKGKIRFIHLDLETGGEDVGIIQLSSVAHDANDNKQVGAPFNKYVKPHARVRNRDWSEVAMRITGLSYAKDEIKNADFIDAVWGEWLDWCKSRIPVGYIGCLVAWNGKGSDCKWLFKHVEESKSPLAWPPRLEFFMDPMSVISGYKSCKLNMEHSKILGYGLAAVWCYIKEEPSLKDEHNSLIDATAQFDIVKHKHFRKFWGMAKSVMPLKEVWKANRERFLAAEAELGRPVPDGWVLEDMPERKKLIDPITEYNSGEGGGKAGPTSAAYDAIGRKDDIADVFDMFAPKKLFEITARETNRYAAGDYVTKRGSEDDDDDSVGSEDEEDEGNDEPRGNRRGWKPAKKTDPGARRRYDDRKGKEPWEEITVGALLVFHGILMFRAVTQVRRCEML